MTRILLILLTFVAALACLGYSFYWLTVPGFQVQAPLFSLLAMHLCAVSAYLIMRKN